MSLKVANFSFCDQNVKSIALHTDCLTPGTPGFAFSSKIEKNKFIEHPKISKKISSHFFVCIFCRHIWAEKGCNIFLSKYCFRHWHQGVERLAGLAAQPARVPAHARFKHFRWPRSHVAVPGTEYRLAPLAAPPA